jgi:hypothetical protein
MIVTYFSQRFTQKAAMISNDRILELIKLGNENRNLDYKGAFSWATADKDEKVGIAKDILAFSNTRDGGVILVGVNDKTGVPEGLTEEQFASFDQTRFNDFIHEFTEPKHTSIVSRRDIDGRRIVAIEIPEFAEVPILCKKTVQSVANPRDILLRKAGLYKRTDKATSELIEDADDMRELLNRGLLRRQDELLSAMNRILRPKESTKANSEGAGFLLESEEAATFMLGAAEKQLLKVPHWEITLRPVEYVADRISDLSTLQRAVRDSAVSLRGWNFPHINERDASNFDGGFQSLTDWKDSPYGRHVEVIRAYRSGLVSWMSDLWEERGREFEGVSALSFLSTIFSVTEWVIFAQRFYESVLSIGDSIHIAILLRGSRDRILVSRPPAGPLFSDYIAKVEPISVEGIVEMTDLRADSLAVARKFIRRIFELFNWNDFRDEVLQGWQKQLLEKRL